jgi:hypothetical protein
VTRAILPKANLPIKAYSIAQTRSRSDREAKNELRSGKTKGFAKPICKFCSLSPRSSPNKRNDNPKNSEYTNIRSFVTKTNVSLTGEKKRGTITTTATANKKSQNILQDFSNLESIF